MLPNKSPAQVVTTQTDEGEYIVEMDVPAGGGLVCPPGILTELAPPKKNTPTAPGGR